MRIWAVVFIACGLPLAAMAGSVDFATRDPACTHVATVQYLDCEVAVVYTCPAVLGLADPIYREESFAEAGLTHYSLSTRNGFPLLTANVDGSVVIEADASTLTETSIDEVMKTGVGGFASAGLFRWMGIEKPAQIKAGLSVSGQTLKISGLTALVIDAEVSLQVPPPMGTITSIEKGYLMPDLGFYVTGETTGGTFFKADRTPHRPMSISLPGQPDFETTKPAICGSLSLLFPQNVLNGVPA